MAFVLEGVTLHWPFKYDIVDMFWADALERGLRSVNW